MSKSAKKAAKKTPKKTAKKSAKKAAGKPANKPDLQSAVDAIMRAAKKGNADLDISSQALTLTIQDESGNREFAEAIARRYVCRPKPGGGWKCGWE